MKLAAGVIPLLMLLSLAVLAAAQSRAGDSAHFFESRVRPLLAEKCKGCHGAQVQKSGLRLDSRKSARKGGSRSAAIVPGRPESSLLVAAVRRTGDLKMPPDGALTESEVRTLTEWIRSGAYWPESQKSQTSAADWWSFKPLDSRKVILENQKSKINNPIDYYVEAALAARGIKPAPLADRRTLIRRAYFDLIGLPPSPEEYRTHKSDRSYDWYERMIDALLASPHYGERWGRHWLDVARYADSLDSRGLGGEGDIAFAWRYRDWVVDAFNRDMPYPEFIANQVAGDLLPSESPGQFNRAGVIATGFLAIGNWGNGDADKEKILTDIADDQVDVVSRAFMGLTVACARCHDHKFDPITQRDYYAMAGIFFSTHILAKLTPKGEGEKPMRIPLESPVEMERRIQHAARLKQAEERLKSLTNEAYTAHAEKMGGETAKYLLGAWEYHNRSDSAQSTEEFAAQRGLQEHALTQWLEVIAPGRFREMSTFVPNVLNAPGVVAWKSSGDTPSLTINTNAEPRMLLTFTLPPSSVAVHPGPSSGAAISWRAASGGEIKITGRAADADPVGGDGVAWVLAAVSAGREVELATGDIANGGEARIPERSRSIKSGDEIQLRVLPKSNHGFDTTVVQLEIASGDSRWDLTTDVLANPQNPTRGPWRFLDMGGDARGEKGAERPNWNIWDSVVQEYAAGRADRKALENAAEQFQSSFTQTRERSPFRIRREEDEKHLDTASRDALSKQRFELFSLRRSTPPPVEYANGALEGGVPESTHAGVHDVKMHHRGRYDQLGEPVARGFPVVLAGENLASIGSGSGRLQLARWLGSPKHPLTARVMANRIWQHHFGEGIVRTPGNFGRLGEKPAIPELLDYLAASFIENGWSIKKLHREIMLSRAYRRQSFSTPEMAKKDPDNRLFGRQNRRRMDAESFRDAMLSVSGELDRARGGPAIRDVNTKRRALYVMSIRSDRTGYGPLFDAPDSTNIVDQRIVSTVAPQALFMLNDSFVRERAAALAKRVLAQQDLNLAARIRSAYDLLFGRSPTDSEFRMAESILAANADSGIERWTEYCQVLLSTNEFVYVD